MSDRKTGRTSGARPRRSGAFRRLVGRLAIGVAAAAGGYAAGAQMAEGARVVLAAVVGALAVVGAVELLVAVRRALGGPAAEDPLGAAALEASGDAMAVVEDGERVVESNAAYQRLCRSGTGDLALPERFLARIPGSQSLVGELLDAVARRAIHRSAVSFASGPRGRELTVSVHPLGSARRVLWTLRMSEEAGVAIPLTPGGSAPSPLASAPADGAAAAGSKPPVPPAAKPLPAAQPAAPVATGPVPEVKLPTAADSPKPPPVAAAPRPAEGAGVAARPEVAASGGKDTAKPEARSDSSSEPANPQASKAERTMADAPLSEPAKPTAKVPPVRPQVGRAVPVMTGPVFVPTTAAAAAAASSADPGAVPVHPVMPPVFASAAPGAARPAPGPAASAPANGGPSGAPAANGTHPGGPGLASPPSAAPSSGSAPLHSPQPPVAARAAHPAGSSVSGAVPAAGGNGPREVSDVSGGLFGGAFGSPAAGAPRAGGMDGPVPPAAPSPAGTGAPKPSGMSAAAHLPPVLPPRAPAASAVPKGASTPLPPMTAKPAAPLPGESFGSAAGPAPGADLITLWDNAPAGLLHLQAGRAQAPSLALCRMLGYGLADWGLDGIDLRELVAADDLPRLSRTVAQLRGPESLVLNLIRKDGSPLPALLRLAPARTADDTAAEGAAAVALPLDVISRVLPPAPHPPATGARTAGDAGADLFFLRAPVAMALVDAAGRVRAANGSFARLFGPASGRMLAELVTEAAEAGDLLAAARASEDPPAPRDVTLATGGRSVRLFAAALGPSGAAEVALCVIDMTEQKALEAQFAQSQKLQAVGHLAGGVAHDFNNMLTAIIGYCDLLLARHRQSDPSFPDIMQIKQAANRAAGLVRQLLAFSRRQTLRPAVIELTDVISDVSALLRRLIGERITLEVQHARDLWPVKVDVNQFEQVIVNLALNARDAMPDGGTLTLRTANIPAADAARYGQRLPEADHVLVEVMDTGSGIPPEIMDKIFEPFFTTKEVGKGTGLGLSTVYGIIEQTGGTILADSRPGEGTVFRVFLPRHHATAEDAEAAPRAAEPEPKVQDLTGHGRILLVEDEDAVRALASRALSNRGYEVLAAASGAEALEVLAREGAVDLVISDVVMPEMDGPTLLRALRAKDPSLKVIFISGYAEEAFARNLPPTEHFSYLSKPFSLKQLVATVNETLRG